MVESETKIKYANKHYVHARGTQKKKKIVISVKRRDTTKNTKQSKEKRRLMRSQRQVLGSTTCLRRPWRADATAAAARIRVSSRTFYPYAVRLLCMFVESLFKMFQTTATPPSAGVRTHHNRYTCVDSTKPSPHRHPWPS